MVTLFSPSTRFLLLMLIVLSLLLAAEILLVHLALVLVDKLMGHASNQILQEQLAQHH